MIFKRVEPSLAIAPWVECFWVIEDRDPKQVTQKIIPDGFPEIIFHFGQPYEINLTGEWEVQRKNLLAGQIKKHFWLRNTGKASILGIKMKPAAPALAFDINMSEIADQVEDINELAVDGLTELMKVVRKESSFDERIKAASGFFQNLPSRKLPIHQAIEMIFQNNGMCQVTEVVAALGISERQLERLFKQFIGLSPKFYCRIVRFSTIFQLKEQGDPGWIDLTYEAGFADQSHFIRNFKFFTGEDPTAYGFDERNMANFFMKKR